MYMVSQLRVQTKRIFNQALTSPIQLSRGKQVFYLLSEKQYKQLQVDFIRNMIQDSSTTTKAQPMAPVEVEHTNDDKVWGVYIEMTNHLVKEWITEQEADELIEKHDINGEMIKRKIK